MTASAQFYRDLAGIGIELSGVKPNRQCDIERTILQASMFTDSDDRRILGLILSWIKVHGKIVSIGKLKRIQQQESIGNPSILSAFAFFALSCGQHEWKILAIKFPQKTLWGDNNFILKRSGAFEPFLKAGITIPADFIRIRTEDILQKTELCKKHLQVRMRAIFGSNLRADAIFYLSRGVLTATELMKAIGCSYEPAHRILTDLQDAGSLDLPKLKL